MDSITTREICSHRPSKAQFERVGSFLTANRRSKLPKCIEKRETSTKYRPELAYNGDAVLNKSVNTDSMQHSSTNNEFIDN